jgi:hypothetical protein
MNIDDIDIIPVTDFCVLVYVFRSLSLMPFECLRVRKNAGCSRQEGLYLTNIFLSTSTLRGYEPNLRNKQQYSVNFKSLRDQGPRTEILWLLSKLGRIQILAMADGLTQKQEEWIGSSTRRDEPPDPDPLDSSDEEVTLIDERTEEAKYKIIQEEQEDFF